MNLRLSQDAENALEALSQHYRMSKTKTIERMLLEAQKQQQAIMQLDGFAREITEDRSDLMDWLRDA